MTHTEFDAREVERLSRQVTPGEWEVSYGEIWSGGDLAIFSTLPDERVAHVATLLRHGEELPEGYDEAWDAANAELLVRAPRMLALVKRLATVDGPEDLEDAQRDAQALLSELAAEWSRA